MVLVTGDPQHKNNPSSSSPIVIQIPPHHQSYYLSTRCQFSKSSWFWLIWWVGGWSKSISKSIPPDASFSSKYLGVSDQIYCEEIKFCYMVTVWLFNDNCYWPWYHFSIGFAHGIHWLENTHWPTLYDYGLCVWLFQRKWDKNWNTKLCVLISRQISTHSLWL